MLVLCCIALQIGGGVYKQPWLWGLLPSALIFCVVGLLALEVVVPSWNKPLPSLYPSSVEFPMDLMKTLLPRDPSRASVAPTFTWVLFGGLSLWFLLGLIPGFFSFMRDGAGSLVAVITSLALGLAFLKMGPAISLILGNFMLKALKWEARRNPVESRQREEIYRAEEIEEAEREAEKAGAALTTFRTSVANIQNNFPQDAAAFEQALAEAEEAVEFMRQAVTSMRDALAAYERGTERVEALWEGAKALARVSKISGGARAEFQRRMISEETVKAADGAWALAREALTTARARRAYALSADRVKHMGTVEQVAPPALPAPTPASGYPFTSRAHEGAKLPVEARK